jgi:predicted O-methyltransferase YrrM
MTVAVGALLPAIRPLSDVAPGDLGAYAEPAERLAELPGLPSYRAALDYFAAYPAQALTSPGSRAAMYHLVRALKPKLTLEIGTFHANTTEVIARALAANGGGHLLTIDPFGAERVPAILATWPAELARHVDFLAVNSMELFIHFDSIEPKLDLCFVDGNHAYAYALYDLTLAAKWTRPGGVIVVDDYCLPGVFWAVRDFLDRNPGWREISGAMAAFDPGQPFRSIRPSLPDTGFFVLAAPSFATLGARATSFEYDLRKEAGIGGFALRAHPAAPAGTVHAQVYLRSYPENAGPALTMTAVAKTTVAAGQRVIDLVLAEPLVTPHDPARSLRAFEIALVWQPADGAAPLSLLRRPQLALVER